MAFFKVAAPVLAFLVAPVDGVKVQRPHHLRGGEIASVAMHLYRHDCGTKSKFSYLQIPGAGMEPSAIKPFTQVLKDGFYQVDCVKDYLFEHGDKFGDHFASYKLQEVTNVSIVHYAAHVPKEDREQMTHEVCFEFCRTVPDMLFFGLTNGRACYCAPYYEAEASDSSECDEVCDGDKGLICGGKTKSSLFSMHMCSNTAEMLTNGATSMTEVGSELFALSEATRQASTALQSGASTYQDKFGQAGDPGASDLMQSAKAFAGVLDKAVGIAGEVSNSAAVLDGKAKAAAGGELSSSKTVGEAEDLIKAMEETTTKVEASIEELEGLTSAMAGAADEEASKDAVKQYYPAMYFVNKTFDKMPSTCTGEASEKPIVASLDGCARACDNDLHECVGFSYFPGAEGQQQQQQEGPSGLCFLFSKLKTIRYYTGCSEQGSHNDVMCYGKLSKFESTDIAPNPSGKCEGCLKEAKQADRCFE
mmetsp:Transcript_97014/g.312642  ORF Transcript_97014/g.312642 Transcript_97014/m.312642 type:complete len:476 (-) Transcript_97014:131-1558(-)